MESGHAELRRIRSAHSPKAEQARRALVELYTAAEKPDLAAKYEAAAAAVRARRGGVSGRSSVRRSFEV